MFSAAFTIYAVWYSIKARRVYYDDSYIYLRCLFSNKTIRLQKEQIRSIQKTNDRKRLLSWELIYKANDESHRRVLFAKNFMNYDFDAVVGRFTS